MKFDVFGEKKKETYFGTRFCATAGAANNTSVRREREMIEVILNDRLGKKVRVKCKYVVALC